LYGLALAEKASPFSSKERRLLKKLGYLFGIVEIVGIVGIVGIEVEQALDDLHASEANLLSA
jgi:hypothetical protein